jgi:CheY-like chemotaxis protein
LPEVILLDLNMPDKNGWDFLETLRQCEKKLQGRTMVFILTSSIAASDKALSQNYRLVKGFLHKPLDEASLAIIQQVHRAAGR